MAQPLSQLYRFRLAPPRFPIWKPVTFTASVGESVLVLNSPAPAGSVIFKDGSTTLATVPLSSGSAAFTTSGLAAGSHKITATYPGNSHYNRHVSAPLTQTVQ